MSETKHTHNTVDANIIIYHLHLGHRNFTISLYTHAKCLHRLMHVGWAWCSTLRYFDARHDAWDSGPLNCHRPQQRLHRRQCYAVIGTIRTGIRRIPAGILFIKFSFIYLNFFHNRIFNLKKN